MNGKAQLRRQMRVMLNTYRRSLSGIAKRYDIVPVYIEEAQTALNMAEARLKECLDFATYITACNIAGDAILKHANAMMDAAKEKKVSA